MAFESKGLSGLRQIDKRFPQLMKEFNAAKKTIKTKQRLHFGATEAEQEKAQQAMNTELSALKNGYVARFQDLQREIEQMYGVAMVDIETAITRPVPKTTEEALLRELKETRAWNRIRPQLDQAKELEVDGKATEIISRALGEADNDSIAALRAELPAYLTARVRKEIAKDYIPVVMESLDATIGKSRPEVAMALSARAELKKGVYNLTTAINYSKHEIEKGGTAGIIPTWSGQTQSLEIEPDSARAGQA